MNKRKTISIILFGALLCLLLTLVVFASESDIALPAEEKLTEILTITKNQIPEDEMSILMNRDYYADDVKSVVVDNKPTVRIIWGNYWIYSHLPFSKYYEEVNKDQERLQQTYGSKTIHYAILSDNIVLMVTIEKDGSVSNITKSWREADTNYLNDIKQTGNRAIIGGETYDFYAIYCFDGYASHKGTCVYYLSEKGNFVKYYDKMSSEDGIWFSEESFREYGKAYWEYASSYENNYDEFGNPKGGGVLDFLSFVESYKLEQKENTSSFYVYLIFAGFALVVIAVCLLLLSKRRKADLCTVDNKADTAKSSDAIE